MRCLRASVTLLLVMLWLPATSHALLEQAGWIHTQHGDAHDDDDTDNDHDLADGNCAAPSNCVRAPHPQTGGLLAPSLMLHFLPHTATLTASTSGPCGPAPPSAIPFELSHIWQFLYRTSLSPRAPSLIS